MPRPATYSPDELQTRRREQIAKATREWRKREKAQAEENRLALQRGAALVRWLDERETVLQDEMNVMVEVPARLLRDLRRSHG